MRPLYLLHATLDTYTAISKWPIMSLPTRHRHLPADIPRPIVVADVACRQQVLLYTTCMYVCMDALAFRPTTSPCVGDAPRPLPAGSTATHPIAPSVVIGGIVQTKHERVPYESVSCRPEDRPAPRPPAVQPYPRPFPPVPGRMRPFLVHRKPADAMSHHRIIPWAVSSDKKTASQFGWFEYKNASDRRLLRKWCALCCVSRT
ncbi:hypothetical protein XA68_18074 [Ophiocordyceps unilateralis]|uniref:Uncharacterized protein n=1 Tax=Ophiocordyceps unilateralis TaxID=268505 RepID=A0A2A9P2J3_OPHUN|nr:hypothetical protein XA68_18074 [Ophiocordyceps unilateralis]